MPSFPPVACKVFSAFGILLLVSAFCLRSKADPVHIIDLKTKQETKEGKNVLYTVCRFALGDAPPSGQAWPENKVMAVLLASKEVGTAKPDPISPEFAVNKNASLVAVNFRPFDKRRGACLLASFRNDHSVIVMPALDNQIAALCREQQKAFDPMDFWVERIDGNVLLIHSQTKKGDRYTLTVRVVPDPSKQATPPDRSAASNTYTLRLVSYSQSKVFVQPSIPFPKFP